MNLSPDERAALECDFTAEPGEVRFMPALTRAYAELAVGFLLGFSSCALLVSLFVYVWLVRDA